MKTTLERLGIPSELGYFDGIVQFKESAKPVFRKIVDRKYDRTQRKWVETLKSFDVYAKVSTTPQGLNKREALNFLNDMIHGHQFEIVDANNLVKPRKEVTIEVGPQAGNTFWIKGQHIELGNAGLKWTTDSVYMNAEAYGSPSEGWAYFEVEETTNFHMTNTVNGVPTTTIKTVRHRVNRKFTHDELEALGYTDEYLSSLAYSRYTLAKPDTSVFLTNVSTDLEQLDENVYWPNAYFNYRDDSTFDFTKLIPHYANRVPDFIFRIRAYNDSTNADYPAPNYGGMGNFGKAMDLPFENETAKPIRVEWGANFGIENTDTELVVTFAEGSTRAALGLCIEYKPLDGKKIDNEIYLDVRTGEVIHSIFDLA
jgi:hypothetical protein